MGFLLGGRVLSLHGWRMLRWTLALCAPRVGVRMSSTRPTHVQRTQDASRSETMSAATVVDIHQLSPTVKGFTLRAENRDMSFRPGQWVDLHIPGVETVGGYSFTSAPHQLREEGTFKLAIQHSNHPPTLWMSTKCQVGDKLTVRVGGDFCYSPASPAPHNLLLIAGGVGINPLLSMLLHHSWLVGRRGQEEEGEEGQKTKLLYSAKNVKELIFKEEIGALCSRCPWLSVNYFVTREDTSLQATECRRLGHQDIAAALSSLPHTSLQCYVCGPPPMIDSVQHHLTSCGMEGERVFVERWW